MQSRSLVIVFILVLIIAGLGGYIYSKRGSTNSPTIDKSKRQVVYLTNGQVYFGNLSDPTAQYVLLRNAFFPQAEQSNGGTKTVTLKPVSDTYATENDVYINKDQILSYENLSDGSKINQAINNFKPQAASPSPASSPTP